jgi:glutamate N-acetyltransferase / amino-acid N-acetyltransferase
MTLSFGRLLGDGDANPNDSVILLANGAAEVAPITDAASSEYGAWQEALDALCADLAQQVLRDATAGGKVVQVCVRGAASEAAARQVAQSVARAPAVRRSCAHATPDWGGMLVAIGASGVELRAELLELRLGSVLVMLDGVATHFDTYAAVQALSGAEVELFVDLHMGAHAATVWTATE